MFRFTIREMLLLTLSVAIAVGWWINRRQLQSELREAARYKTSAERWHYMSLYLADAMRERDWYVRMNDDASSASVTPPSQDEKVRENLRKLNNANPLPRKLVLPDE